jgi:hypothetical protein
LVGIGTATPYAKLDVNGTIRAVGGVNPSSGVGLELSYQSSECFVNAYDRSGSARVNLKIAGLLTIVNAGAGCGNVLIGTVTDNASGGILQINGDCTPDVDTGGDLGTANVQWDDIRWKGNLIQNATTRISSTGKGNFATAAVTGLASYANNAAAAGAGLAAGDLYTETGTDPLRVCVVY